MNSNIYDDVTDFEVCGITEYIDIYVCQGEDLFIFR